MLETVHSPRTAADLRKAMKQAPGAVVMAGGTLVMPKINQGAHGFTSLINLQRLGIDGISVKTGVATIGAAATIAAIGRSSSLKFLHPAVNSIASPTLRNMATIGGNLIAQGDLGVCLVALNAKVSISGPTAVRKAFVEDIIAKGLKKGEIVTAFSFAIPAAGSFKYLKASRRSLNSASIITVAAVVSSAKGLVSDCRIALGGVAPKIVRAKSVEKLLTGKPLDAAGVDAAAAGVTKDISPASDAYASAWYRARVAPVYVRRAILGQE